MKTRIINSSKCLFLTTNPKLTSAVRKYNKDTNNEQEVQFADETIPPCVTDVFLGTVLWLNDPIKINEMSDKQLLSQMLISFQPDVALNEAYDAELKRAEESGRLRPDICYMLRASTVAKRHLVEMTLGDAESVTSYTPNEILQRMENDIIDSERKKAEEEKAEINKENDREIKKLLEKNKLATENEKNSEIRAVEEKSKRMEDIGRRIRKAEKTRKVVIYTLCGIGIFIAIVSAFSGFFIEIASGKTRIFLVIIAIISVATVIFNILAKAYCVKNNKDIATQWYALLFWKVEEYSFKNNSLSKEDINEYHGYKSKK